MNRVTDLLKEDQYFIRFPYNQDCRYYDSKASNAETAFHDEALKSDSVYNLELWTEENYKKVVNYV